MNIEISEEQLDRLRALRLWHWSQAMLARRMATFGEKGAFGKFIEHKLRCKNLNAEADFHIQQVQTLNDFFDAGDTAEQDMSKTLDKNQS